MFLVRTSKNAPENFVISVIVRSKKTGKLQDSHQLIYNSGDEGFSKFPPGQPGNVSFKTLSEFLENYRTIYRLGVTRDVFNYSTASVIREREAHNRRHEELLREQDAIVEKLLDHLKLVDTTQYVVFERTCLSMA